jgi:HEAT repeat protein
MRRSILLLPVLLLLFASPTLAGPKETADLVKDLSNTRTRGAAYRELLKRKDPKAANLLQGALPTLDPTGQVYGVNILKAIGTKEADGVLRTLSMLGDPHLRVTAGAALHAKGEKRFALSIADALMTPKVPIRTRVAMLQRIHGVVDPAVQTAVAQLVRADEDPYLLYYALYYLHRQVARDVADCAGRLVTDKRREWRAVGVAFLLRFGREGHAHVAAEVFREDGIPLTDWYRFHYFLSSAKRVPKTLLDALAARLPVEKNQRIVLQTIAILTKHAHREAARPLRRLLQGGDEKVAIAAFDALLRIPGGLPPDRLHLLVQSAPMPIRLRSVDALRRHDDRSGLAFALRILTDGSPGDRAEAARVVGRFRRSEIVTPLIDALKDSSPQVRLSALAGLKATFAQMFPYRRFRFDLTGYRVEKKPVDNGGAVGLIRQWWEQNRTRDW